MTVREKMYQADREDYIIEIFIIHTLHLCSMQRGNEKLVRNFSWNV
jgi:hypothetical protein